jgi:hypothetical protein
MPSLGAISSTVYLASVEWGIMPSKEPVINGVTYHPPSKEVTTYLSLVFYLTVLPVYSVPIIMYVFMHEF